jgi:hypothetical protein
MASYTKGDDFCASVGQRIRQCIDNLGCSDLNSQKDPCPLTASETDACSPPPQDSGGSDVSGIGTAGSASIGDNSSTPMGGTTSYGPSSSSGGSSAVGPGPVTCKTDFAAGGGQPAQPSAAILCEEGRDDCSDGHQYSWLCATDSEGRKACSCFVDSQVTGSFAPGASDCPTLAQVDAGCSFGIVEN